MGGLIDVCDGVDVSYGLRQVFWFSFVLYDERPERL